MATGLPRVVVLVLCMVFAPCVFGGSDCESYRDIYNNYHTSQTCWTGFCCGDCSNRFCCSDRSRRITEDEQDECIFRPVTNSRVSMILGFGSIATIFVIIILCCFCPCCCLYKMCRKPTPVVATTTHTTVVTTSPQHYPQQATATPGLSYQGAHHPGYQPIPVQPGYAAQPMTQGYGTQPMPTLPYQGQPFSAAPPPTYQEAIGPSYPPIVMPYSQAAFTPGNPTYPLQPPVQPQPSVPPAQPDYLAQPAYNPDYVTAPPPKMG